MEEVSLEVEAITPIFIAGADQKNIENEGLRVPSLKGLLRWWFRAIMGGMTSITDLRELESKVFGSTNRRSSIKVVSVTNDKPSEISIPSNLRYLRYLWFSIYLQKQNSQRLQCYPSGTRFKILLRSNNKDNLKIALGCLWTLIYLGGVGARMRRGAGSLKVNNVSAKTPYEFIFNGSSVNEAKKFIEDNLAKIFKDFKEYAGERFYPQKSPKFAALSHAKISLISRTFTRWIDCLEKFGNVYGEYRKNKDITDERFIWGLPIRSPHNLNRYENSLRKILGKKLSKRDVDIEIKRLKKLKENELLKEIKISKDKTKQIFLKLLLLKKLRQASPLFIGVMDLNGSYTVRIVKFYTSIHHNFSQQLRFLKQDLDNFDAVIAKNKDLGEIEIKVPEVK